MKEYYCDIEADSLGIPDNIWCIVCINADDDGEILTFTPDNMGEFKSFAEQVDKWIGHNFLTYDAPALAHHFDLDFTDKVEDTIILSRMFDPKLQGGHSLNSWGKRFKYKKIEFNDFSKYTPEMLDYCVRDVELTRMVHRYLKKKLKPFSEFSLDLEHKLQAILNQQKINGFYYDIEAANKLEPVLQEELDKLEAQLHKDFPPVIKEWFTPKVNRPDLGYVKGVPIARYQEFNIGSPKQVQDRLRGFWEPFEKTKGFAQRERELYQKRITQEEYDAFEPYGYKISEDNLATISDDAPQSAKNIGRYLMLRSRLNLFKQWKEAYDPETHRVHGTCISLGASTHRAAHFDPNMGNIISTHNANGDPNPYGKEFRELWTVPEGKWLLGVDAEGIQLRILAELIGDDNYIQLVTEGDVHTYNMEQLGSACKNRDSAKRFIYSWVLGAGIGKTAEVLGCDYATANAARQQFVQSVPGLAKLKAECNEWESAGAMRLFDGRLVKVPSAHKALAIALQGNEKIIMGYANILWQQWAKKHSSTNWFRQVNFVHDEWETELDHRDDAVYMGELQQKSIATAGQRLKLRTPFAGGTPKIGRTWYDVH